MVYIYNNISIQFETNNKFKSKYFDIIIYFNIIILFNIIRFL